MLDCALRLAATTSASRLAAMGPAAAIVIIGTGQRTLIWYIALAVILTACLLLYPQARRWRWDQPGGLLAAGAFIAGVLLALPAIFIIQGRNSIPRGVGINLTINSAMGWIAIMVAAIRATT